jgi:hypothetical protein
MKGKLQPDSGLLAIGYWLFAIQIQVWLERSDVG